MTKEAKHRKKWCLFSISDNETIEATGLSVLIADHAIVVSLDQCAALDLKQAFKVLEELDLKRIVL